MAKKMLVNIDEVKKIRKDVDSLLKSSRALSSAQQISNILKKVI